MVGGRQLLSFQIRKSESPLRRSSYRLPGTILLRGGRGARSLKKGPPARLAALESNTLQPYHFSFLPPFSHLSFLPLLLHTPFLAERRIEAVESGTSHCAIAKKKPPLAAWLRRSGRLRRAAGGGCHQVNVKVFLSIGGHPCLTD